MLSAKRRSDGQTVFAYLERKEHGPFACPDCNETVILKTGRDRINHFAHETPLACEYAVPESAEHLRCKRGIAVLWLLAKINWNERVEFVPRNPFD